LTIPSGNWCHWISCPRKHTFRYQNQVSSCTMSRDNIKCGFQVAAILKSNMADIKKKISSGPISENVRKILMYICAKFGTCITKCTIGLLYCLTNVTTRCKLSFSWLSSLPVVILKLLSLIYSPVYAYG